MTPIEPCDWSGLPQFAYGTGPKERRVVQEVLMLAQGYGAVNYDDRAFSWVHVPHFRLPGGWNLRETGILMDLPEHYPSLPPDGFYLTKNLRDRYGRTPGHYFQEQGTLNPHAHRGWAWFCIHTHMDWRSTTDIVSGHNLLKYLELIRAILSNP